MLIERYEETYHCFAICSYIANLPCDRDRATPRNKATQSLIFCLCSVCSSLIGLEPEGVHISTRSFAPLFTFDSTSLVSSSSTSASVSAPPSWPVPAAAAEAGAALQGGLRQPARLLLLLSAISSLGVPRASQPHRDERTKKTTMLPTRLILTVLLLILLLCFKSVYPDS